MAEGTTTAPNHVGFGAQAMHYFQREHEAVRRTPLALAAAWRGAEMARRDDWIVRLTPAQIDELERAADAAAARGLGLDAVAARGLPAADARPARSPPGRASCCTGAASCWCAACRSSAGARSARR